MESIEEVRERIRGRIGELQQGETQIPEKKYCLLIVEDEQLNLDALVATFKKDYEVLAFTTAVEALDYVRTRAPRIDLVLTDQRMPKMTGIQFLEEINKLYPQVMKLILTGYTETKDLIDAINKGEVHRYITKPADPAHLRLEVKQALERYKLEKEKNQLVLVLMDKNKALESYQSELKKANLEILQILGTLGDIKDPNRGKHSRFVAQASEFISQELNLPHEEILRTVQAAHLHDIGKMGLPDWVLSGAGATTEAADKYNRQHPLLSEAVLLVSERLKGIAPLVRSHHEWWNGTGYPDGLKGEAIPLPSRIIMVSDGYDEFLADNRDGDPARRKQQGIEFLKKNKGTRFEPHLVDLFMKFLENELAERKERFVSLEELQEGMIISQDVLTEKGFVLIPKGTKIRKDFLAKVRSFSSFIAVRQPVAVYE